MKARVIKLLILAATVYLVFKAYGVTLYIIISGYLKSILKIPSILPGNYFFCKSTPGKR